MRFSEVCKSFLKFFRNARWTRWTRWTPLAAGPFAAKRLATRFVPVLFRFSLSLRISWNINKSSNGATTYSRMWRIVRITCVSIFPVVFCLKMFQDAQCVKSRERHQHWEGWKAVETHETSNFFAYSLPYILWLHGNGCQAILLLEELEESGKDTVSPQPSWHWKLQVSQQRDIDIVSMHLKDADRSDRTTGLQMQPSQAESLNLIELINGSEGRNRKLWRSPCSLILLKHLCSYIFFSRWICSVCALSR